MRRPISLLLCLLILSLPLAGCGADAAVQSTPSLTETVSAEPTPTLEEKVHAVALSDVDDDTLWADCIRYAVHEGLMVITPPRY